MRPRQSRIEDDAVTVNLQAGRQRIGAARDRGGWAAVALPRGRRHRDRPHAPTRRPRSPATCAIGARHTTPSTEFHTAAGPFTLVPTAGPALEPRFRGRPHDAPRLAALSDGEMAAEIERRSHAILGGSRLKYRPRRLSSHGRDGGALSARGGSR